MNKSIEDLKFFIKEMFQFNENDLDFGIYKIYNLKRKYIESFIEGESENDLIPTIDRILEEVSFERQRIDASELKRFLQELNRANLLDNPKENYSVIETFINTEQDESKRSKILDNLKGLISCEGVKNEIKEKIYNHILGFFQMYYSNGDFGYNDRSRDLYKVPYEADYNGSDTMFHWKHKGSLYIKSANSFNSIKFELNGKKIEYRLETNTDSKNEDISRNNNKDDQLKHYQFKGVEKVDDVYRVIFNFSNNSTSKIEIYRSICEKVFGNKDIDKYLTFISFKKDGTEEVKNVFADLKNDFDKIKNGQMKGLSSLRQNKKKVAGNVKKNFERGANLYDESNNRFLDKTLSDIYILDQKINSFYIGHDADYFIHENLNLFLINEKQSYIKNYILDDLESIYLGKLDNTTILIAKAFDRVSGRIIEFLSIIEDFQKDLFVRKKKVVESEYCITLDYISEDFYPEILDNKLQIEEWKKLFSIDVSSIESLKENPTMVLDTKFFRHIDGSNVFKDKILCRIDDLEEKCNGFLMNSENYQGIEVLQTKYKNSIEGIYIDPPYNTDASSIIYKNNFKHSSWLSLLENRLLKSKQLLNKKEGMICVAIDDEEVHRIRELLSDIFEKKVGIVVVRSNPAGRKTKGRFSPAHEYALFYGMSEKAIPGSLEGTEKKLARYPKEDEEGRFAWANFIRSGSEDLREDRPTMYYPIYVGQDDTIRIPKMETVKDNSPIVLEEPKSNEVAVYPILSNDNGKETHKRWQRGHERASEETKEYRIRRDEKNNISIDFKTRMDEDSLPVTWWDNTEYASANYGALEQKKLFGSKLFDFPKAKKLVVDSLHALSGNKDYGVYLDYFSGSGTTGHAILEMNKADNGTRKFFLIEMGEYFDSVTKPRIQKVIYSHDWNDGKPQSKDGCNKHIFKYQVLEQYEDVLDNLEVYEDSLPESLPIKYLYKPEQNSLDHNLNIYHPFSNRIKYGRSGIEGFVDLIETYNYIVGYFIKTIKTYTVRKKYYKVVETNSGVLVFWREILIDEDDSADIIELAEKYQGIHTIEVNAEFASLQLDKRNNLKVGDFEIQVKTIHKEIFNQ